MAEPVVDRFWRKVDTSGECWEWTAYRDRLGYGKFDAKYAHRVSYELANGPIPKGLYICHHCDNSSCVRPDHLFAGTQLDNMRDAKAKGRYQSGDRHYFRRHPELRRGTYSGAAKLTWDKVRAIRRRRKAGELIPALAREYGVAKSTIIRVVHEQAWVEPISA